ncbi:MAG: hypothetical protein ACE5ER_08985, partial [Nitrospinaceae bacterium]
GHRWINHEWLTEVLFYAVYAAAGSGGLLLLKGVLGVLIVHGLSGLYFARSRSVAGYLIYFLLAVPVMAPGFMIRPHLMTFLFLTLLWMVLHRALDGRPQRLLWAPLIFLLWANCHGGVVAGLGIFFLVTMLAGARAIADGDPAWKWLAGSFIVSCLAGLVNPYGLNLWTFFVHTLSTPRAIGEWNAVPLAGTAHWEFKLLAVLFAVTLILPGRKRAWEVAAILAAFYFGFKHQRHTVLAALLLCPYLPLQWARWQRRWRPEGWFSRAHGDFKTVVLALAIGALTLQGINLHAKFAQTRFQILVEPTVYPTDLARFMEANRIDGNLWVPFDWGEYFIWKRPASRVSIDGRFRTAYPEKVIRQVWAAASGQPGLELILDRYAARYVITRREEPLHEIMEQAAGWVKIYQDPLSKLFVRETDPLVPAFRDRRLIRSDDPAPYTFPG